MHYLGTVSKTTAWSWFISEANHSNIIVIQVYAPTTNAKKAEVKQFYEDLQDLLELTPKEDVLFIIGNWNAKADSQGIPGVTGKFGLGVQNEAGQRLTGVLPREHTGHRKHPLQTTQEMTLHMGITRWVNTEIRLIIFFAAEDGNVLHSGQKQDLVLTVAQIINSLLQNSDLKNIWKSTRPFRYNLHQILYDYTVEVTKRFKGLDLRLPEELCMEVSNTVQEMVTRTIPRKRNARKQNGCLSKRYK